MKKVIARIILMFMLGLAIGGIILAMEDLSTTSEAYIPSENEPNTISMKSVAIKGYDIDKVESEDKEVLKSCRDDAAKRIEAAQQMAEGAKALGYTEDSSIVQIAKEEERIAQENFDFYDAKLEKIRIAEENAFYKPKAQEYGNATIVWRFLKDQGYNDYVCAGILGNFMAEVGGQTLNLQYWLDGNGFYGLAQWSHEYYPGVIGCDLTGQLNFLIETMPSIFRGYGFDKFLSITSEKEAALVFAQVYERCGSGSYYIRQRNATVAYNYFVMPE